MILDNNSSKRILILAANPKDTSVIRLDEEVREIDHGLQRAKIRACFSLVSKFAVRPKDIQRAMLDFEPHIVHFCGHGNKEGIILEDEQGKSKLVESEALATLFKLFSQQVECVILNACYSEQQAMAISKHIKFVIGMNKQIGDKSAITFAVGFFDGIGAGKTIEFAYDLGCNSMQLSGVSEHLTPVLIMEGKKKIMR